MENYKLEKLFKILSEAEFIKTGLVKTGEFSVGSFFDFEVISPENEIEDSILFTSLDEAVEIVSQMTINKNKVEVYECLNALITKSNLKPENEFRFKIIISKQ